MVQAALASMLGFGQVASREKPVSSHVPYLRHVDEQNVGDARHHGRAREAPDQGIEVRTLVAFHSVSPRSTCLRTTT